MHFRYIPWTIPVNFPRIPHTCPLQVQYTLVKLKRICYTMPVHSYTIPTQFHYVPILLQTELLYDTKSDIAAIIILNMVYFLLILYSQTCDSQTATKHKLHPASALARDSEVIVEPYSDVAIKHCNGRKHPKPSILLYTLCHQGPRHQWSL